MAPAESGSGSVVSWGEVLWDLYPDGPRLGGAPANVAYHLAAIGRPVALVSRVGDDREGRDAVARLGAAGVDVDAVQIDPLRPTGSVGVTIEAGEARYSLQAGCAWEHIGLDAAATGAVSRASALCFGTLALRRGRAALEAALAALPADAIVASDPNLRAGRDDPALIRWVLERARIVKLNDGEAAILGGVLGTTDVVAWLLDRGAELVAITRGARGCSLHRQREVVHHGGFPVTAMGDSVGCGDAFTAVLLHLQLAGVSLDRIAAAACRYAAFVASHHGATPPIPQAIASLPGSEQPSARESS